jgi:hypothetical protein
LAPVFFGQYVRRFHSLRRADGEFVYIEGLPDVVNLIPAWMLDTVACASMG